MIWLEEEHRQITVAASEQGLTTQQLIRKAVLLYLSKTKKRVLPCRAPKIGFHGRRQHQGKCGLCGRFLLADGSCLQTWRYGEPGHEHP